MKQPCCTVCGCDERMLCQRCRERRCPHCATVRMIEACRMNSSPTTSMEQEETIDLWPGGYIQSSDYRRSKLLSVKESFVPSFWCESPLVIDISVPPARA